MNPNSHNKSTPPENVEAPHTPKDVSSMKTGNSNILRMFAGASEVRKALFSEEMKRTAHERN